MKPFIAPLIWAAMLVISGGRAFADNAGFLYAFALHDSHTAATFYSADAMKPLGPPQPLRPYLHLLVQRDSRAADGLLLQTLNDNYGLLAGGMQYESRTGLRVFAQVGEAFAFGPQTPTAYNLKRSDFRGGLELYRNWNDSITNPHHKIGSLFASAVYYSRYENEIVFAQAERGYELGASEHPTQLYLRLSADADTRRFFYNNTVNVTLGARVLPLGHEGPSLALEESYNNFVGPLAPLTAAGETRQFYSFRPIVSFGASF